VLFQIVKSYCGSMKGEQMNGYCQIFGCRVSTINQNAIFEPILLVRCKLAITSAELAVERIAQLAISQC
jgi:hypothetical protein